jgi:hypothetical protein
MNVLWADAVDFEGDGCSCARPPGCCTDGGPPTAACAAHPSRMQSVSILDASGALLAPVQTLREFEGGSYLRFKLSGSVVVRVEQLCAGRGDAMLNALFFD